MRKALTTAVALLALQSCAWGCEEAEELGHHWEIPGYRSEMLTQITWMAAMSTVVVVGIFLKSIWRKRRAEA